jgi:hypothetical protein
MRNRCLRIALLLGLPAFALPAIADMVVTFHSEHSTASNFRYVGGQAEGDFTFTFGKNSAVVTSPLGKTYILDFGKKTFTSMNPVAKTYYQMPIADVLALGDKLPVDQQGDKAQGSVTFDPSPGVGVQPDLAHAADPYRLVAETTLSTSSGAPGGFTGGYASGVGAILGGSGATQHTSFSGKKTLEGQLWMGDKSSAIDYDQMNTAVECVLLWGAPQLKRLSEKIHDSGLAIYGGNFTISTQGQTNAVGITPPSTMIKATKISAGFLDPSTLSVPENYRKVAAPTGAL